MTTLEPDALKAASERAISALVLRMIPRMAKGQHPSEKDDDWQAANLISATLAFARGDGDVSRFTAKMTPMVKELFNAMRGKD